MSDLSDLHIHDDEEDNGGIFLDESDIIEEVGSDDEELPDADDDSESEHEDEIGDSQHIFTGPTDEIDHSMHIFTSHTDEIEDSLHIFTGHTEELYSVACSPTDTALVATGGGDDKGFLWKINNGDWASVLNGHKDSVSSLAFSYDGKLLASGSLDVIVQVWDAVGNLKGSLKGPAGGIEWLRWHPRGNVLLAGSEDYNVWMWDADKPGFGKMFSGHGDSVTCGGFTPDGKTICTGSDDATLRVWNPKTGKCIHVVQGHSYHTKGLTCLSISSTSNLALTGSKDESVHIVNITTGRVVKTLPSQSDSIECVGFAPSGYSGSWAAVGSMDKKMVIWDIEHYSAWAPEPHSTCEHEDGVVCLAWLGKSCVATGCVDGVVRFWDSRSGECVKTFREHSDAIQSLALSANGDHLVSASSDCTACVFEVGGFR